MRLVSTTTEESNTRAPLTIADLPDIKRNAGGGGFRQTQPLTQRNVVRVLAHLGFSVRFDVLAHKAVFSVDGVILDDVAEPGAYQSLCDALVKLDIGALGRLDELVMAIALENRYHPFEDWLLALPAWDGRDRITELAGTVVTANPLWPVYLENWLVQVIQGACGWRAPVRDGLPHVLVLVGGQGIGKTRWFRALGCGWMKTEAELHLNSGSSKDHQIEILKWPMAELSELNGIFRKSDIEGLKAFLGRPEDSLRAPYARRALSKPRMTVLCGSVNEVEFLNDASGSRRFWPVTCEHIKWGFSMDWGQLWAQALGYWREDSGFALTREEDALRVSIAADEHTLVSTEIETLAAYWDAHKDCPELFRAMNRSEILTMLGYRNCSNKTVSEAGRCLINIMGKMRTIGTKQRSWLFPYTEFARDPAMWRK